MFSQSNPAAFSGLCLLAALFLAVSAEKEFESRPGMIQEIRTAMADLAGEGRTYLGRLAGEQTVLSVQKVRDENDVVKHLCGSLMKAKRQIWIYKCVCVINAREIDQYKKTSKQLLKYHAAHILRNVK